MNALKALCGYDRIAAAATEAERQRTIQQVTTCIKTRLARAQSSAAQNAKDQAALTKQNKAAQESLDTTLVKALSPDVSSELQKQAEAAGISLTAPTPQGGGRAPMALTVKPPAPGGAAPGAVGPGGAAPAAAPPGPQLGVGTDEHQSVWATPNACSVGSPSGGGESAVLSVHRMLMRPEEVADDFGYRLGKRFIVYQVTVTNDSKDFQYEVSDIVVDLKPIYDRLGVQSLAVRDANGNTVENQEYAQFQAASQDLDLLRGIPEKGQDYDPRNMTLHIFQGIGSVGSAVSGLTSFSNVMGSAMGDFNGAFIQAFTGIFPDHTSTQLNRLSDMAFSSNALIEKLQTKKFAVFIPESFVLDKADSKKFRRDPRSLLNELPLDQLNICVDGLLLVQAATTPDPTFSPNDTLAPANGKITLADSASGATIYYTTDGSTPTTNSEKYTAPIQAGAAGSSLTIKALAVAANQAPSNTIIASYTAATQSSAPTIACGADKTSATITPNNAADTIYYTTDGTSPTRKSASGTGSTVNVTFTGTSATITAVEGTTTTALSTPVTASCPK